MKNILNIFKSKKDKKDIFFETLKIKDYGKTPVFSFLLCLIIAFSVFSFICIILKCDFIYSSIGYNTTLLVLQDYQIWRIFTFPFFQVSSFVKSKDWISPIISFLILFYSFKILGFYFEVFLKSKKTAFVLIIGIILIGITMVLIPIDNRDFFYGSEWFVWLIFGGFFFIYINSNESKESKKLIFRSSIKIFVILFLFSIYKYANPSLEFEIHSENRNVSHILLPIISVAIGYLLTALTFYKKLSKILFYSIIIFFIIFILFLIIICFNYYYPFWPFEKSAFVKKITDVHLIIKKLFIF